MHFAKHIREGKRRVQNPKSGKTKSKKITRCTERKLSLGNNYCMIRRFILGMIFKLFIDDLDTELGEH